MRKCIYCGKETERLTHLMCKKCYEESVNTKDTSNFLKADSGKLEWSLIPFKEMEEVVKVLMEGAKKYSVDNWKKCDDLKRYKNSLLRHTISYISGEKIDEKANGGDGLSHLAHAICNCLFLMWFDNQEKEISNEELKTEYQKLNAASRKQQNQQAVSLLSVSFVLEFDGKEK